MHRAAAVIAISLAASACTVTRNYDPPDADPANPYPPPRTDLVPAVGSANTLEIAAWNIENFPGTTTTPAIVADVIASLDLDIVVVEEIASEVAFAELLDRLPEHEGVLSEHRYTPTDYQKIGVIYRSSLVQLSPPRLLFVTDTFAFPRPPFAVTATVDGADFELIGVHLKAGGEASDVERRRDAMEQLDAHLRAQIDGGGESEVVVAGDYNEDVTSTEGRGVFAPLLTATDRYAVRTEPLAQAGGITFLGFGGTFIDHVTTTAALDAKWPGAQVVIPRLDQSIPRYRDHVSDHLPVVLIAPR
jgi:endonuclease/exonuclease/phosphatase family metal-dependent hydrolase